MSADVASQGEMQLEDGPGFLNMASCKTYPSSPRPSSILAAHPILFINDIYVCIYICKFNMH